MKPENEANIVQFSYHAQPESIFMLPMSGQCPATSHAQMLPHDGLTCAPTRLDRPCNDPVPERQTTALLLLAHAEAAYRPKVRPVRPASRSSGRPERMVRPRAPVEGRPVRPAHPTHLVIVSARRARPARLSAWLPVAEATIAARSALYPTEPTRTTQHHGFRIAAHLVAITGIFMSFTETVAAQRMLGLF
jgi:hypothetical protein